MACGLKVRGKHKKAATNESSERIDWNKLALTGVAGRAGLSAADPVVAGAAGDVTPRPRVAPLTPTRARHGVTRALLTLTRGLAARAPLPGLAHRVASHS